MADKVAPVAQKQTAPPAPAGPVRTPLFAGPIPYRSNRGMANLFRLARSSAVQPPASNLTISSPNEPAELEAERIAGEVMRMPAPAPVLHRACAACDDEKKVHRSASGDGPGIAPPIVGQVLSSPGQPLPDSARNFFEPRLGADLSAVRVHTDSQAARSADAVQAKAYTVGSNIAFAAGEYAPQSESGKGLLAHELVHVVQQNRSGGVADSKTAPDLKQTSADVQRQPAPAAPTTPNAIPSILQLILSMCRRDDTKQILERIERDAVQIVLFETAFDKWKYDDGREEQNELRGLSGNTEPATRKIRLRQSLPVDEMMMTLYHEMQHWIHRQAPRGPRGLESEIQARIASERLAIDSGRPPTRTGYRKADGTVDEAFIRAEINASPHYNPTGRERIGRRYEGETVVSGPWTCPPIGDFPDPGRFRNYA